MKNKIYFKDLDYYLRNKLDIEIKQQKELLQKIIAFALKNQKGNYKTKSIK